MKKCMIYVLVPLALILHLGACQPREIAEQIKQTNQKAYGLVTDPNSPVQKTAAAVDKGTDTAQDVALSGDQVELGRPVLFETASDVLAGGSKDLLRQVASTLLALPGRRGVRIEGHTDSDGDPEANVDLSERRARRVLQFLMDAGVPLSRMNAVGFGPTKPVADNASAEGRARNRRVEFHLLALEAPGGGP